MTTYNYMIEMQELCFRISQACKTMGKTGTQDVYAACEKGFYEMAKELTCEEAGSAINPDQIDTFICTQNFCIEQERMNRHYFYSTHFFKFEIYEKSLLTHLFDVSYYCFFRQLKNKGLFWFVYRDNF